MASENRGESGEGTFGRQPAPETHHACLWHVMSTLAVLGLGCLPWAVRLVSHGAISALMRGFIMFKARAAPPRVREATQCQCVEEVHISLWTREDNWPTPAL